MVAVRNLRVDYGDVCAVRDICLDVQPGEICGLIGPNGAGKTSTLRALIGLVEPTYGDIAIGGHDLDTERQMATRSVGFMPDAAPIYEDLTVYEFLDLWAASYYLPRNDRPAAIERYLELVELTEKRDAMTAGLSRGMKQRLILAKTLLPEPAVLLLDEPASGVDPYGRALLKDVLRQLATAGRAILISSHILAELSEFCTSVCIMQKGSIVASGSVDEVARRVFGASRIAMEVVSGAEDAGRLLAEDPRVGEPAQSGNAFEFSFTGGPDEASDLLAALIAAGVRVSSFSRRKEDLESVFLRVGAREVS